MSTVFAEMPRGDTSSAPVPVFVGSVMPAHGYPYGGGPPEQDCSNEVEDSDDKAVVGWSRVNFSSFLPNFTNEIVEAVYDLALEEGEEY